MLSLSWDVQRIDACDQLWFAAYQPHGVEFRSAFESDFGENRNSKQDGRHVVTRSYRFHHSESDHMLAKHFTDARIVVRDREVVHAFWTTADCPPEPGTCWKWRGYNDQYGRPAMRVCNATVLAVRVAWYAVTGEYPTEMRFTHSCGDEQCIRPSHVRWRASRTVRRAIAAHSDGYGDTTEPVHPDAERAAADRHAAGRWPDSAYIARRAAS
jgi:hypothetical protein